MSSNEMIPPCNRCGGDMEDCNCSGYSRLASHLSNSKYSFNEDDDDDNHNDYSFFMEDSDFR